MSIIRNGFAMENVYNQVRYWIDDLPRFGQTTFSTEEAEARFKEKTVSSVRRSLARLVAAGRIQSVWKGYYAVVLPDYGKSGIVPPIDYIDQLMRYLGKDYYVALLSAAAYSGATHQAVQVFQIISDSILHGKNKNGVVIDPALKKRLPYPYILERNSRTASVKFSSPELTAIDLLLYPKKVGGLNFIVTVLEELAESLEFDKVDADFFSGIPMAPVQRLGYLLEAVLGKSDAANCLHDKFLAANPCFRYTPLSTDGDKDCVTDRNAKWKILVNYEPESDL